MRTYVAISLAVIVALGASGCVADSQYREAVGEADSAKGELERAQAQKGALEQQVKTLKELNAKLSQEARLVKDELQRIEHGRDKERGSLEERNKQMEQQVRALAAQYRLVRKDYQELKRRNRSLQSTVGRYQKELKARQPTVSPSAAPATLMPPAVSPKPVTSPKASTPTTTVQGSSPLAVLTPGLAKKAKVEQVNMNTASALDMVLRLGLTREVADKVITNRPYRIKGELIARNVISKETFDSIKNRITVRQ